MTSSNENVGIALALVVGAGASTALGAAVVFFPSIVKLASRRVLAGSLGFAGGVMTYVSFIEIFGKAQSSFEEAGNEENTAYLYATLFFFAGVVIMMALNAAVSYLLGGSGPQAQAGAGGGHKKRTKKDKSKQDTTISDGTKAENTQPPCCSKDPVGQLERLNQMADDLEGDKAPDGASGEAKDADVGMEMDVEDDFVDNLPLGDDESEDDDDDDDDQQRTTEEENKRLVRMGINTALAIGLHNFPEGLATFVAALDDPRVGAILAFAIAIHNIPEGLCVALPIYYATGNRLNAFMWALLSGASEFIAALLGWAVLANSFSPTLYGLLFAMVAGMMVIISIRELLPTAHFYDPEDSVVTYSFIGGMMLIAFSLVLFLL